jgi:uncharacterized membrane protein
MDYIIGIAFLVIMYWLIRFAWRKNQDELKKVSHLNQKREKKKYEKQVWIATGLLIVIWLVLVGLVGSIPMWLNTVFGAIFISCLYYNGIELPDDSDGGWGDGDD